MNRRGTEPYARWCGRTVGVTPPPTRFVIHSITFSIIQSYAQSVIFHILILFGFTNLVDFSFKAEGIQIDLKIYTDEYK